jgi:hypothetical protein
MTIYTEENQFDLTSHLYTLHFNCHIQSTQMKRSRPQPQPDRLTKGPSRGSYQNDVKVQFINAVFAAMKANPDGKVSIASIGCLPEFKITRSTACSWWNNRDSILAAVAAAPGLADLRRIYPRKMGIVEDALYEAIGEELVLGVYFCCFSFSLCQYCLA